MTRGHYKPSPERAERREKARTLWDQGVEMKVIADRMGVTAQAICMMAKRHGWAKRVRTLSATVAISCPKCNGVKSYAYDHNHRKPCEICCPHDEGWWLLQNHYGTNNGKFCCLAGCGEVRAELPEGASA